MDNNDVKHELQIMKQAIVCMEQGVRRLDLLDLEILQLKAYLNEHNRRLPV